MSENKISVETVQEPSVLHQYGRGLMYGKSNWTSKKIVLICVGGFLVLFIPGLLMGPPTAQEIRTISAPEINRAQNQSVDLPLYDAQKNLESNNKKSATGPRIIRFSGLQSIERKDILEIPSGTEAEAKMSSGGSDSLVKIVLTDDLLVNGISRAPTGSVLIGQGSSRQGRLHIDIRKLVTPDGKKMDINAIALDKSDNQPGVRGSRLGYYTKKLGTAAGLNFIAGMSDVMQERESVGNNVVKKATVKNALLNGASTAALELSNDYMEELKGKSEVVEVEPGQEIVILFN